MRKKLKRGFWGAADAVIVLLGALGTVFGLIGSVFVIAHYVIGESSVLIQFLNNAAHWLVTSAFLGALAALGTRYRRYWVPLCLPGALVFLLWYGRLFLPSLPPGSDGITFTAMTFNITDVNIERVTFIEEIGADLVGLQEYRSPTASPFNATYSYQISQGGLALLSRFPIRADSQRVITYPGNTLASLRAVVEIDDEPVAVYVAHPRRPDLEVRPLIYDPELRALAFEELAFQVQQETLPVLLLCDCNTSSRTNDYLKLSNHLHDSWFDRGFGFGFTAPNDSTPLLLIRADYIWRSDGLTTISVRRFRDSTSDHLPVFGEYDINHGNL